MYVPQTEFCVILALIICHLPLHVESLSMQILKECDVMLMP